MYCNAYLWSINLVLFPRTAAPSVLQCVAVCSDLLFSEKIDVEVDDAACGAYIL